MAYRVLARRWRPQRFDDVIGQQPTTRTLRNAIATGRLAHAFVFAGPRGVGKTTTARILARALNCERGPTGDPCGVCDMCREIAEGRDLDVLEIDAATHTQVDNVREVIIEGLAVAPLRDRYKIFIIDEVHQLSNHSFNALLKSIEEPPPHVAFVMATTELHKIPETITSRAQVFEFRTVPSRLIAGHLRRIVDAEGLTATDDALALIARAADGSMRDAQSALDQVIAFASGPIDGDSVAAVLGLVGRDLSMAIVEAVGADDTAAIFELVGRAVEGGRDLRLVVRELARLVRDLMVLSVDPARLEDPDIAGEGERGRLSALARRFSREDLLRAFDQLAKLETDLRQADEPRFHVEMALVRWVYLRQLTPLAELIERLQRAGPQAGSVERSSGSAGRAPLTGRSSSFGSSAGSTASGGSSSLGARRPVVSSGNAPAPIISRAAAAPPASGAATPNEAAPGNGPATAQIPASAPAPAPAEMSVRDRFAAEVRRKNEGFSRAFLDRASGIDFSPGTLTLRFPPAHRVARDRVDQQRAWLETLAGEVAGEPVRVQTALDEAPESSAAPTTPAAAPTGQDARLKAAALADPGVQAVLDVFSAEIRNVEEIDR